MSSMPQGDGPQQRPASQQRSGPGEWSNPGARPGTMPGQQYGAQQYGGQPWSGPGAASPISEAETRVTWRRIFQYWIDAFFVSIIPYLVSIPFDRSGRTWMNVLGGVIYVVLFILIGLWYWVIRPHSHNGQTFAMKWFGLRVVSKDGGPATITQMFVRWICLLFDSAPWMWPFTGLVGLIVMLCSRYRQRIGDHAARTLVISAGPYGPPQRYAYAGQPGAGAQPGTGTEPGMGGQPGPGSHDLGPSGDPGQHYGSPGPG